MQPAVEGSLRHLTMRLQGQPGGRAALVLATDGLPEGCGTQSVPAIVMNLAAARAASIPTYVIGVFTAAMLPTSQPVLAELATAGGTGQPFVLEPNQGLTQAFTEALNQIRGAALACEFQIPRPPSGTQDFGKVNVRFTGAAGSQDILYVGAADRCDPTRGGWYYDVNPGAGTPDRIIVCPATCRRFQAEAAGQVEIGIGCTTRVE